MAQRSIGLFISSYRVGLKLRGSRICERHTIMHSFSSVPALRQLMEG